MTALDVFAEIEDDLVERSHTGPFLSAERYVKVSDILAVFREHRLASDALAIEAEATTPDCEQLPYLDGVRSPISTREGD